MTLLNSFLLEHSVFYLSLREKIHKTMGNDIGMLHRGSLEVLTENLLNDRTIESKLWKNLKEIIGLAKKENVTVVIAKQAVWLTDINVRNNGILESDKLRPFYKRIYLLIDEIGRNNKVKVISAEEDFENLSDKEKDNLFWDGVHLTDKGNNILASLIFEEIKHDIKDTK